MEKKEGMHEDFKGYYGRHPERYANKKTFVNKTAHQEKAIKGKYNSISKGHHVEGMKKNSTGRWDKE
jgi:hypothetical protein